MSTASQQPPVVEAIDRALVLLTALADAGPTGVSLRELTAASGISKATAYRALSTMRARGFVMQEPSGEYRLGPAATSLATWQRGQHHLKTALTTALGALSRNCDELVHLGVWDGDQVVYLDKVEPSMRAIRVWSNVGQRVPAASTALGRALLASSARTDDELRHFIDVLSDGRHVTLERLRDAVNEAAITGFASETEENEPGIACIARAIVHDDKPIAAISVTCLASGLTLQRAAELRRIIAETLPPLLPDELRLFTP